MKFILITIYVFILSIPIITVISNSGGINGFFLAFDNLNDITYLFLRIFALYGISLIFIQILLGAFMQPLMAIFGPKIFKWHIKQGIITYLIIILHPVLYLIFNFQTIGATSAFISLLPNFSTDRETYITVGKSGLILLTITVSAALLRDKSFFMMYWKKLHILNYLVFSLILFHSFFLGTDTRIAPFIYLYPIFIIGLLLSFFYRRIYRG